MIENCVALSGLRRFIVLDPGTARSALALATFFRASGARFFRASGAR